MSYAYDVKRLREEVGQLLERHDQKRSLGEFTRYAEDPVGFIRTELKGEPWSKQVEIAEAVRDNRQVVVRAGNGLGKDWLAARLALWAVYCRGALAVVTGPTERQVKEIVMGEVRRAFSAAGTLPGELYEMALRIDRDGHAGILAFTSNDASRLTGFHAPSLFVFITEAQGVEPTVFEGALANATGEDSRIFAVGNPIVPTGRFYRINRSAGWRSIAISAHEHPNVQEGREVIPGAVTRDFIQSIGAEYGVGSGVYAARVLGEFPEDSDETLVRRSWLEHSAVRWNAGTRDTDAPQIFAVDPARFGADKTALAIRRGRRLERLALWEKQSTMATVGKVQEHMRANGAALRLFDTWAVPNAAASQGQDYAIVVDVVGLGGGVVDRMTEQGYQVNAFNGAASPEGWDKERFLNARAEAFWHLRRLLEEGQADLPQDDLLWEELMAIRWKTASNGKIQMEPKDLTKAHLGRSPDRADAVSMAFWLDRARSLWLPDGYFGVPYTSGPLARI